MPEKEVLILCLKIFDHLLMSLYRKYRPKDFPSLVGQDHIKTTLLNAIKAGKIAHAYLFTGPRGTGKTTTARLLAKAINAEMSEDGRFDGSELAEEIDQGRLIDVIEIDAASNRGIDEMRDLREKINYSPTRAKNKVYIIDEVHMLTKEAFNALLKTLEEPPSFVFFILATTEINKVPETIISRCQRFDFRRINDEDLVARLREVAGLEGVSVEEEALKIVARQARGGLRDALSLFEQLLTGGKLQTERVKNVLGISNWSACEDLYQMMKSGQGAQALQKLEEIFQSGGDLLQLNRDMLDYLRQQMLLAVRNSENVQSVLTWIANFQEAHEKQKFSYIPELPLEVAIVKSTMGIERVAINSQPTTNTHITSAPVKSSTQTSGGLADSALKAYPAPINTTAGLSVLDLETLLQRWTAVHDRLANPLVKRSLMAGKVVETTQGQITIAFSSNFHREKLFANEVLLQAEQAIAEEFGMVMKLHGQVRPELFESPPASADVLADAMNTFGGEIA